MTSTSTNDGSNDADVNTGYVRELYMVASSDQAMYRLAQQAIKALRTKIRAGRFDEAKAPKIFENVYT
jgi:hypothetical protein